MADAKAVGEKQTRLVVLMRRHDRWSGNWADVQQLLSGVRDIELYQRKVFVFFLIKSCKLSRSIRLGVLAQVIINSSPKEFLNNHHQSNKTLYMILHLLLLVRDFANPAGRGPSASISSLLVCSESSNIDSLKVVRQLLHHQQQMQQNIGGGLSSFSLLNLSIFLLSFLFFSIILLAALLTLLRLQRVCLVPSPWKPN